MSQSATISVIMSVFNGEIYLRESIESILNQDFSDFEFIIVNDKSTDNSLEIIKEYEYLDMRIKLINNKKNIGLTKSLNIALKEAKGKYIARQDADDISLPQRLSKEYSYLKKNPNIILIGTSVNRIDEKGNRIDTVLCTKKPTFDDILEKNRFKHGSVLFRKNIVYKLGGYNELFRYVQDYELWLRIAQKYEVMNLSEPLYNLRIHNESIGAIKIEESRLYGLLAKKIIKNEINEEELENIRNKGISYLYSYLNKNEIKSIQKEIYQMNSDIYLKNGEIKEARGEYKKIMRLSPLDIKNNINIIRSYLGTYIIYKTSQIFNYLNNFLRKVKNEI